MSRGLGIMSLCWNQHPDIRNKQALDFIQEIILKKSINQES